MKTCPSNMLMLDQYNLSFLCSLMAHRGKLHMVYAVLVSGTKYIFLIFFKYFIMHSTSKLYMKSLIIYIKILLFFFDGLPVRGLQI